MANKLEAQGGNAGVAWDDGVHDDVKKIYVYVTFQVADSPVTFFKADYIKDSKPVLGSEHGMLTQLGAEEFELGPGEYITAVTGYYDDITGIGVEEPAIVGVKFKTNKRESILYGTEVGTKFVLEKKDHKIVGFHGQQVSDYLHKLGVYVAPIAN